MRGDYQIALSLYYHNLLTFMNQVHKFNLFFSLLISFLKKKIPKGTDILTLALICKRIFGAYSSFINSSLSFR